MKARLAKMARRLRPADRTPIAFLLFAAVAIRSTTCQGDPASNALPVSNGQPVSNRQPVPNRQQISNGQQADLSLADLVGPNGIAFKYYIVELRRIEPGQRRLDVGWTDLSQLMPDGHVTIHVDAGYAKRFGDPTLEWTNVTLTYGEQNFTSSYPLTGLRHNTWYLVCFKATHAYSQYGIQSAVCNYRKTFNDFGLASESLLSYAGVASPSRLVVTVRLDTMPFSLLSSNVSLHHTLSTFPLRPSSYLRLNQGQTYVVGFESLSPGSVYEVCAWVEHTMRGGVANYTECKLFATKLSGVAGVVGEDSSTSPGNIAASISRQLNISAAALEDIADELTRAAGWDAVIELDERTAEEPSFRLKSLNVPENGGGGAGTAQRTSLVCAVIVISFFFKLTSNRIS